MSVQPTIVSYAGDGSTKNFTFQFDYLNSDYVKVRVDGTDVPFTFTGTKAISVTTAPLPGETLVISRETDRARLVDFTDGSVLIEDDLDLSALQVLHIVQEALDLAGASLALKPDGSLGAAFRRISDVGAPTEPKDAVTKEWAETAMTSQLQQATAAKNAAEAAEADTLTLKTQATNARNAAQVAQAGAEAAQSAAETAQAGAQAAQSAADTAKLAAQAAQSNASSSASAAAGSASAAASSASAAAQSATDAAASAAIIDPSSYVATTGDAEKAGRLLLDKQDNDGHLTLRRMNGATEVSRFTFSVRGDNGVLLLTEGDGPSAGGDILLRFDRDTEDNLVNPKSVVTREKADLRYRNKQDDFTLLCDYTASRKSSGTITLSEALTNFDELVVDMGNLGVPLDEQCPHIVPTQLTVPGTKFEVQSQAAYQRYSVVTATQLTIISENSSWLRKIWGRNRR